MTREFSCDISYDTFIPSRSLLWHCRLLPHERYHRAAFPRSHRKRFLAQYIYSTSTTAGSSTITCALCSELYSSSVDWALLTIYKYTVVRSLRVIVNLLRKSYLQHGVCRIRVFLFERIPSNNSMIWVIVLRHSVYNDFCEWVGLLRDVGPSVEKNGQNRSWIIVWY